jgi:hypothetical protein
MDRGIGKPYHAEGVRWNSHGLQRLGGERGTSIAVGFAIQILSFGSRLFSID